MADDNFKIDESDFDDAIIEIANEIEQINKIRKFVSQKSDPKIALKIEMELKKVESSSTNIFQVLKTIQEVQIYSSGVQADAPVTPSTIEFKYSHHINGNNQKYHPLTITETVIEREDISDYHNFTIEDLFEDLEPEEKSSVLLLSKNKPNETCSIISDNDNQHQFQSENKISDKNTVKTVNIPNNITKNITRQLKIMERDLIRNLLKMQKR
ncbi:MAG: hypothetical protein PHF57_10660 [Methanoregula sp.]|jgi:hypothetical protein|nr:hypothetical protein [Methanoregula sp.]